MQYQFQSLKRSCTIAGNPKIEFVNYIFITSDEETAERMRRNIKLNPSDYWEFPVVPTTAPEGFAEGSASPKVEPEQPLPKRRGRPPKTVEMVVGQRRSGVVGGNDEGEKT